jgi:hypothetical protein
LKTVLHIAEVEKRKGQWTIVKFEW